jgi:hypothetical protein
MVAFGVHILLWRKDINRANLLEFLRRNVLIQISPYPFFGIGWPLYQRNFSFVFSMPACTKANTAVHLLILNHVRCLFEVVNPWYQAARQGGSILVFSRLHAPRRQGSPSIVGSYCESFLR